MNVNGLIVAILVSGVVLLVAATDVTQVSERIARVESGLLPPINWKGEARAAMAVRDRMAYYQAPGVGVAVIEDGTLAWVRGWGAVRAGGADPVTPDTLFQAGSISKTVTALLVLRLVSEGRIGLDDPVNKHLKSWRLPDSPAGGVVPVTIRHLLSHGAGLTPITYPGVPPDAPIPTPLELLQGKGPATVPPVTRAEPPGRRFTYSNPAYLVLEQLLTDVSGTPFDELARTRLFAPLGMRNTTFARVPPAPLFARAAWGHGQRLEPIASKGLVSPAAVGGLWSTPADLARLLAAFFASYRGAPGAPLKRAVAREAMQAQVEAQGLCAGVEGEGRARRLAQMGAMPGFTSYVVGFPEVQQGTVVMINAGGRSGDLALELARAVAAEYRWPGYIPEYERVSLPPDALTAFAGQYEFTSPAYPKIQIAVKEGRLYWGDREMQAVRGGRFVVPSAGIEVEFIRDATGAVVAADYRSPGMRKTRITRVRVPSG